MFEERNLREEREVLLTRIHLRLDKWRERSEPCSYSACWEYHGESESGNMATALRLWLKEWGKENIAFIFIITHLGFPYLLHRNKAERGFKFLKKINVQACFKLWGVWGDSVSDPCFSVSCVKVEFPFFVGSNRSSKIMSICLSLWHKFV